MTPDGRAIGMLDSVEYDPDRFFRRDTALVVFGHDVSVSKEIPYEGVAADHVTKSRAERVNPVLCKLGTVSGLTCGQIVDDPGAPLTSIAFLGGSRGGDSGAPVWTYNSKGELIAVGTLSGGSESDSDVSYVDPISDYLDLWSLS